MFRLDNKTAIVTGGGGGIGKAIATVFAKQGAKVFVLDMDEQGGQKVVADIRDAGGKADFKKCNVSQQNTVDSVVAEIMNEAQQIDILVNNAGIAHVGNAENTAEADFDRLTSVNVKGVYNFLHAVIPQMKKSGGGVILNMASVASSVGIPDRFAYSMTKGAVVGMTLSVAKDYIHQNIRCNCVSPGRVHTPFVDGFIAKNYPGQEKEMFEKLSKTQPIGRMAQPEEIANLVLYLCSEEASFITGCDYAIDGGFIKLNN
ncbi:MAG: glucose 1-dehydrogenase [Bacteroidetes bacterium]|nr:glucose 1-dehydrogenase [Bacteroidota bacterium]